MIEILTPTEIMTLSLVIPAIMTRLAYSADRPNHRPPYAGQGGRCDCRARTESCLLESVGRPEWDVAWGRNLPRAQSGSEAGTDVRQTLGLGSPQQTAGIVGHTLILSGFACLPRIEGGSRYDLRTRAGSKPQFRVVVGGWV